MESILYSKEKNTCALKSYLKGNFISKIISEKMILN